MADPSLDDATLARRIGAAAPSVAREEEAELWRRHAPAIRLYGQRHLRSSEAAAELVQEVLLTVIQNLRAGLVREPERLGAYVLGTCRLLVQDRRRTDQRRRGIIETFSADFGEAQDPPQPLDLARLAGCMEKLTERDRSVLLLSFYAERTPAQIAEDIATSQDNVRLVRHRALARLGRCVTGGEESP